ncbi:adenylate cyclase [Bradyrhizobium erythrophlei]|nr:adenylate cyclase [Bradyrhizobium erythrophlei]
MTAERLERRLAAVLAADVAGYSRLMGVDEEGTLARLKAVRKALVDSTIANYRGRIVKTTGDGMLVEFASAVDAVRGAVEVQRAMGEQNASMPQVGRIEFRIGIHVGDIIIDDGDIFGDGVNVAARLEGIAEPGGVCMSNDAYRQVRGKVEIVCDDMGPQHLKNIAEPIQAWRVRLTDQISSAVQSASTVSEPHQALPLPDKPSIAVLPFQNMSGDPEQEYFADGMVEDIITALSRFKWLFVIARNSSFTFKGKAVDIKEVGRRLGVRYVLEGSVRKAAGKVRIAGQLIDAVTGAHLWADRFERDLTDVFVLQDEVTVAVVSAVQPKLLETEIEMTTRRRPEDLTAYDFSLRARQQFYLSTRESLAEAIRLAHRALELDPRSIVAAALAALIHLNNVSLGFTIDPQFDRNEAVRLSRLALSLDENDEAALSIAAWVTAFFIGDYETAIEFADRAVASNPNDASAWRRRGWTHRNAGQYEEATRSFERGIRLSPLDPALYATLAGIGQSLIELRRFDEAVAITKKALRQNQSFSGTYRGLASALAHLGRDAEAREVAVRLLEVDPTFTISGFIARGGQSNSPLLIEGLRKAGLPE